MYIDKIYTKLYSNKDWNGLEQLVSEIRQFASNPGITDSESRSKAARILKYQYDLNKKTGMGGWRREIESKFIPDDRSLIDAQNEWKDKQAIHDAKVDEKLHPDNWKNNDWWILHNWNRSVKKDKNGEFNTQKPLFDRT